MTANEEETLRELAEMIGGDAETIIEHALLLEIDKGKEAEGDESSWKCNNRR